MKKRKKAYEEMYRDELIEALKKRDKEIKLLNFELSAKGNEIAELEYKYQQLDNVHYELLAAERKADDLERESADDRAYDIWHALRNATAEIARVAGLNTVKMARLG